MSEVIFNKLHELKELSALDAETVKSRRLKELINELSELLGMQEDLFSEGEDDDGFTFTLDEVKGEVVPLSGKGKRGTKKPKK